MTNLVYGTVESVGERCFVVKAGANVGEDGICYCAIRTSGAYGSGDASIIKSGSGAVDNQEREIGYRIAFLFTDLQPNTTYYIGAVVENGSFGSVSTNSATTLGEASNVPGIPKMGVVS